MSVKGKVKRLNRQIEKYGIDKMQNLRLDIDYQPEFNSYIIRVYY